MYANTPREPTGPRAEFWPRLGGFLIDGIVVGLPLNLVLLPVDNFAVMNLIAVIVNFAYAILLIGGERGQTVGMRVVRVRAIDSGTGGRVDYSTAAMRHVISIVSGIVLFLGYLWMLWDPEKQTWQDKVAGTYVVPAT